MKYCVFIIVYLLSFAAYSQINFYDYIEKDEYDSLANSWRQGRIFLKGRKYVDGYFKNTEVDNYILLRSNDKIYKVLKNQVTGLYVITGQDTAKFVMFIIDREHTALHLLLEGRKNGISLFGRVWITDDNDDIFAKNKFTIRWEYYLWKQKLIALTSLKILKSVIKDNEIALQYYKQNKKKLKNTKTFYTQLLKLLTIYNE